MNQTTSRWQWDDSPRMLLDTLAAGGMLAIPTESSYALAVDPRNVLGVDTVYRCKGRGRDKGLPVVLGDLEQLAALGADPYQAVLKEIAPLWPGPLSVIVSVATGLPAATAGTLAVRVPGHERLRELLLVLGMAVTATSANPSGENSVSIPDELDRLLGGWHSVIVDDGELGGGPPSTIVQATAGGLEVIREGAVSMEMLRDTVSLPVFSAALAENPVDDSVRS